MNQSTRRLIAELEAFMAGRDDALALPRDAAEFLHALVLARSPRRCVEIGTSYGYSGLWTAAALTDDAVLLTIDRKDAKTEAARGWFERAGLSNRVQYFTGEAAEVLAGVEGPIDFVLNDADKENCRRYVEMLWPRLSHRAVVLTDNTVSHAEQLAPFVDWVRSDGRFESVHIPIGSGMELSVCVQPGGDAG